MVADVELLLAQVRNGLRDLRGDLAVFMEQVSVPREFVVPAPVVNVPAYEVPQLDGSEVAAALIPVLQAQQVAITEAFTRLEGEMQELVKAVKAQPRAPIAVGGKGSFHLPQSQLDQLQAAIASFSDHARILKFQPLNTTELRADDIAGGDRYHGEALDATATSAADWKVVRFYRDADANILRVRYRTGVVWDNRTVGW